MPRERFKQLRRELLHLEHTELAAELGLHPNTLSNYETGKSDIPRTVEFALYWLCFRRLLEPLLAGQLGGKK